MIIMINELTVCNSIDPMHRKLDILEISLQ